MSDPKRVIKLIGYDSHGYQGHFFYKAKNGKPLVYPIGSEELYEELMSLGTDHDGTAVYADATEEDILASQQAPKGGDIAASDVRPDTDSAERAPVRKSQVQAPRKIVVGKRAPTPQSGQPTAEV